MAENKTNIRIGGDISDLSVAVDEAKQKLAGLGSNAATTGKKTQQSGKAAAAALKNVGNSANQASIQAQNLGAKTAASFNQVSTNSSKVAKNLERSAKSLENSIQRVIAAEEAGGKNSRQYFETLASQRGLDPKRFDPLLKKLDALNNRVKANTISVGQYQNALRMAPAQFTDIITQLAGGQSPFLIAIQQGGQLRDSFGGFGTMLKGLASFITPARVAIAGVTGAVVGLGAAFIQGTKESAAFQKAVILAGGASSFTAGQLQDMSRKVSDNIGAYGEVRDSIMGLAGSGSVAASEFETVVTAIAHNAAATGQKVEDLIKLFEKVEDDPVKALIQLSKNYDTLTIAVYNQAKALVEAGKKGEAVILIQKKLAEGIEDAAKRTEKTLV